MAANTFWGGGAGWMHPVARTDGGGDGSSSFCCFDYGIIGYGRRGRATRRDESRNFKRREHGVLVSGRCCLGNGTVVMRGTGVVGGYPLGKKGGMRGRLISDVDERNGSCPGRLSVWLFVLDMKLRAVRPP